MKKICLMILFVTSLVAVHAQYKLKTADQLINYADPGWKPIKALIDSAVNKVQIMPVDTNQARGAMEELQIGTDNALGTVIYMTGGLLIEQGWIRILGSGSNKLTRAVPSWNKGKTLTEETVKPPYLLVADDALGGFFAMNLGGLGNDGRKMYYLCPWTLQWQALGMSYKEFLQFCFESDLEEFYKPYMSKNWKFDVELLPTDKCYSYVPPLWSKEGKNYAKSVRKYIPIEDQYTYNMQMRKKFGFDEDNNQ